MKLIFLDIDGVLNCRYTKDFVDNSKIIGIEDKKLELLKRIVNESSTDNEEVRIILTSSWKFWWYKDNKNTQDNEANYLDRKFKEHDLLIYDKTSDLSCDRGRGIKNYIKESKEKIMNYIVLDDCIFIDYDEEIMEHLIKTNIERGLTEYDINRAIEILNKK